MITSQRLYLSSKKIKIKKKNLLLYIEIANALEEMPKQIQKEFVSNKKDNIKCLSEFF